MTKVTYSFQQALNLEHILELLSNDIMPNGYKKKNLKIFNQDGFRITCSTLIEDKGIYYVHTDFPTMNPLNQPRRNLSVNSSTRLVPNYTYSFQITNREN